MPYCSPVTTLIERLQDAIGAAYRVERELPLGGLGRLFLAEETASGRQVVVQVLPPDVAARTNPETFRQSVERAARLRHPAILPVVSAGGDAGLLWCVSLHAAGESLRFRLLREGAVLYDEAVQVLRDAADALAYGHARGVCHGDLKPDNMFLRDGRAVLADYGVLCALHAAGGVEGSAPDPAADLHALAAVGRAMLVGGPAGMPAPVAEVERFPSATQFRDALGITRLMRRRRRRLVRGGVIAAGVLAAFALAASAWRARSRLDGNRLVVAPFEVLTPDAEYALWREGLVDVLSANLDGAGPLYTVAPSVAIRSWNGSYDMSSAADLGRRTGARLALYGRVLRTGGDTIRLTARLIDVTSSGRAMAELQLVDPESRLDRLADSLTVALLRELGRSRPIGAVRAASLGSSSLPALKAFLAGEQFYRRTEWDSALASYERAITLDASFALAYYRAGLVQGWVRTSGDSVSTGYLVRAAALNRGLPPRDSMMLMAESLGAAVDEGFGPRYWGDYRRLYATVSEATRRYPADPEVWYEAAEVQYHYPFFSSTGAMLDAFDRAIALDSLFAPAYIHPIELALQQGDRARARRYIDAYLRQRPRDIYADGVRLTRLLLDARTARSNAVRQILDSASADLLASAMHQFRGWADSTETSVLLTRIMARGRPGSGAYSDGGASTDELVSALAYHGHLAEALATTPAPEPWLVASAAILGALPADSAAPRLARSLRDDPLWPRSAAVLAAPWFAGRRDTASLGELARRADSLARASVHAPHLRAYGEYVADGARAFLRLALRDTAGAIGGLVALPDTACERCTTWQVARGVLLADARRNREAAALLEQDTPGSYYPTDGLWMMARARVAERLGDRATARAAYQYVRDVWRRADAALQPYVEEARTALERLGRP
jgi:serine/threonine-protein kinase